MSGKRCKLLRAEFERRNGRWPRRTRAKPIKQLADGRLALEYWSEWRAVKRAWTSKLRRGIA